MRFYDIALFAFIFNLSLGLLTVMNITGAGIDSIEGFGQTEVSSGQTHIESILGTNDKSIFSDLQWVVENVRLVIQSLKTFITVFANATIFLPFMLKTLMCGGGCVGNASLEYMAMSIGLLVQFIYLMGIVQFAMGKSMRGAMMTAAEAFTMIMSGSFVEGMILPYTEIMGTYFYGFMILMGMFLIYMKTQSFDTTVITGVVMSGLIMGLMPENFHRMIYIFMALGITTILYRVTH